MVTIDDSEMLILDGSEGEGGGQIIRNSIVYASLLKLPLRIHSIRAKRSNPGLRAQHVKGLELAADICGGSLTGAEVGSCVVEFRPEKSVSKGGHKDKDSAIFCDIGTAGSICLLLQVALPCWLYNSNSINSLELSGGTNASMAPQIDYFQEVLLPMISKNCFHADDSQNNTDTDTATDTIPNSNILDLDITTRGYFPIGNGVVHCSLHSDMKHFKGPIHPITLMERGEVVSIHIKCFYAGKVPEFVPNKMAKSASKLIKQSSLDELNSIHPSVEIIKHEPAVGSASGIIIVANTSTNCIIGASSLGGRKEKAETVGARAAQELVDNLCSGGCVDEWLQDQLIIFMALADGTSKIRTGCLTQHSQTAIDVATKLTGAHFEVTKTGARNEIEAASYSEAYGKQGCVHGPHIITCRGIGFQHTTGAKLRKTCVDILSQAYD